MKASLVVAWERSGVSFAVASSLALMARMSSTLSTRPFSQELHTMSLRAPSLRGTSEALFPWVGPADARAGEPFPLP